MDCSADHYRSDDLISGVVVQRDCVDRAHPCGHFRVELLAVRHLQYEHVLVGFLAPEEVGLPGVHVLLEPVPLVDALIHADAGLPIELDSHMGGDCRLVGKALTGRRGR